MEFLNVLALRGPNLWAWSPVIEAWVDLGPWKDSPSDSIPGFNERLMSWLPEMIEHRCSVGERGGFFERLRAGTYMAHILEHVTLELQGQAGVNFGYGRARETSKEGVYKVVFKYKDEELARAALATARELVLAAAEDRSFDVPAAVEQLRAIAVRNLPSPGVDAIIEAAKLWDIPCMQLDLHGTLQLGQGSKARRFRAGQSDRTGAIAQSIGEDIGLTRKLLVTAGIPSPETDVVVSAEEAWEAAECIGIPVNVRPQWTSREMRGVTENVETQEQMNGAFAAARTESSSVVVEQRLPGDVFDLLVIGRKVVAATCDLSEVHAEVSEHALRAATAIGLDLASVKMIAPDVTKPLEQTGGGVLQVDSPPALERFFGETPPPEDEPQPVAAAVLRWLFPDGQTGRIPIAAITGTNGKTTVTKFLAHLLRGTGQRVGMATTDGIYLNDRRTTIGDCSGPTSARQVLMNPWVDIAVLETARGGMLRAGLAFDACNAAVVTNVANGDHLGLSDIHTPEQLARVKRMIVESMADDGTAVLNAADPLVVGMAEHAAGEVLFFAVDGENPVIQRHREAGKRTVFVRSGAVILSDQAGEQTLLPVREIPLTLEGRIGFQIENSLAAIGAAWSMGVELPVIAERARNFPGKDADPVRFHVRRHRGATVIVDFGHNVDALRAVIPELDHFQHEKRAALFSSSGDRRNEDIIEMGALLGAAFDRVILYEDADRYERPPGEIMALLREGLQKGGRVRKIEELEGGLEAFRRAWDTVEPGELLLAQAHSANQTAEFLESAALGKSDLT